MIRAVVRASAFVRQAKIVPMTSKPINQNHRASTPASNVCGGAIPRLRVSEVINVCTHAGRAPTTGSLSGTAPTANKKNVPTIMSPRIAMMAQKASAPRLLKELSNQVRKRFI
jgi:hypothetical protein